MFCFLVKEDIDPNIDQESNAQKAHRTYLKGRALNVVADHSPEAEQLLSKAVKLEPNLVDAWIELGECYWKRGDVETAKTCFEGALSHVSNIDEFELEIGNISINPKTRRTICQIFHQKKFKKF